MADDLSRKTRKTTNKPEKKKTNRPKKEKNLDGWVKKTIFALLILVMLGIIAGGITAFAIISNAPELDHDQLTLSQNPEITDMNDEVVTTLESSENRTSADIDEVPQVMTDAVLSIEDARFYDHFGIDIRRLGGAVIANIRSGFGSEGASTITQQVVKNLYFDFDKTITRKLQEQYLAVQLEQQYTKDQILEMYLNAIYFSDGRYGIVEAANYYFSKDLSELAVEDAALLAGIPQRPTAHNPFNNPETAKDRRDTVINQMVRYEKITEEEGERAKSVPIEEQLEKSERETGGYQSYIDEVLNEVENIDGIEASDIYTGGLKIYSNLDTELQEHVEDVMQSGDYIQFPDEYMQAGVTLMNTNNGRIHALGGMREAAEAARGYNWATNPSRQAGSANKPIFAYGPAIDNEQWSTYHQIEDEPHEYSDGTSVTNFNSDSFQGNVSMREALKDSLNIPAVKAIQETGLDNSENFADRLGITVDPMLESYALGTNGVSSLEMAGAYGAFGNEGNYNQPHTVRKVEFPDGQVIDLVPEETRAMNDYTAFMISDMLQDVITDGTASRLQMGNFDVAGKTGSSNFTPEDRERYGIPAGGQPDAWFVGYSPELTASIWTGYPSNEDGYISRDNNDHHISMDIFQAVMNFAHEGRETGSFSQPDSVVEVAVEESTGMLPSEYTPSSEIVEEFFVRGTEPGTVSEEYEIEEVSGIDGLNAEYNESEDTIDIIWDFPEEERDSISFLIEISEPGSDSFQEIESTDSLESSYSGPEQGETYNIRVTPVNEDIGEAAGEPSTVQVGIPDESEETEEENNNNGEENNAADNEEENLSEEESNQETNENDSEENNNNNEGGSNNDNSGADNESNNDVTEEPAAEEENNEQENAQENDNESESNSSDSSNNDTNESENNTGNNENSSNTEENEEEGATQEQNTSNDNEADLSGTDDDLEEAG
ncbi:penicillin-binding protein 1A [Alkalicoccus halolimnae]|uniref:PBP1A family penicillin-binding protein n=1 Tax=Alkalicoccus halolimnae TaxID=1667239 RepID=A0A5C7F903_9BACI|nr:penicillin-binding protein 1A [Alkalicoccus halolimnae]TXF87142.1 PBP1A family penicillin-binding protein [Alkalicoccus halolimnae]